MKHWLLAIYFSEFILYLIFLSLRKDFEPAKILPVILASQEVRSERSQFKTRPGRRLGKPPLNYKPGIVVHIYNPSCVEGIGRRIKARGQSWE
jgi:hypothetical protein